MLGVEALLEVYAILGAYRELHGRPIIEGEADGMKDTEHPNRVRGCGDAPAEVGSEIEASALRNPQPSLETNPVVRRRAVPARRRRTGGGPT
jgi:hypothetical protein